jgi:hypothetical protein
MRVIWAPLLIAILLAVPMSYAHDNKLRCTNLYSLTFQPQKHSVILSNPTGKTVAKDNVDNIEYNAGVVADHRMALMLNSTDQLKILHIML